MVGDTPAEDTEDPGLQAGTGSSHGQSAWGTGPDSGGSWKSSQSQGVGICANYQFIASQFQIHPLPCFAVLEAEPCKHFSWCTVRLDQQGALEGHCKTAGAAASLLLL